MKNTTSRAAEMGIGELSKRTGVNIETIRYYERSGVMPKPPRTEGGTAPMVKNLSSVWPSYRVAVSWDFR